MEDKLKLLLEKCNLDLSEYPWINDCKLTKISVSKKYDRSTFNIESPVVWPIKVYNLLLDCINNVFNDYPNNKLNIKVLLSELSGLFSVPAKRIVPTSVK